MRADEDLEFIAKAIANASIVEFLPEVLSHYVQHRAGITRNYNVRRFDVIEALNRTSRYLQGMQIDALIPVSDYLEHSQTIEHFEMNMLSCVNSLMKDNAISARKALMKLRCDLTIAYPLMISAP